MLIYLNGRPQQAADGSALAELVALVSERAAGIAVALNGEVVPRGSWPATALSDGDRVDVLTAVQGG